MLVCPLAPPTWVVMNVSVKTLNCVEVYGLHVENSHNVPSIRSSLNSTDSQALDQHRSEIRPFVPQSPCRPQTDTWDKCSPDSPVNIANSAILA